MISIHLNLLIKKTTLLAPGAIISILHKCCHRLWVFPFNSHLFFFFFLLLLLLFLPRFTLEQQKSLECGKNIRMTSLTYVRLVRWLVGGLPGCRIGVSRQKNLINFIVFLLLLPIFFAKNNLNCNVSICVTKWRSAGLAGWWWWYYDRPLHWLGINCECQDKRIVSFFYFHYLS